MVQTPRGFKPHLQLFALKVQLNWKTEQMQLLRDVLFSIYSCYKILYISLSNKSIPTTNTSEISVQNSLSVRLSCG